MDSNKLKHNFSEKKNYGNYSRGGQVFNNGDIEFLTNNLRGSLSIRLSDTTLFSDQITFYDDGYIPPDEVIRRDLVLNLVNNLIDNDLIEFTTQHDNYNQVVKHTVKLRVVNQNII